MSLLKELKEQKEEKYNVLTEMKASLNEGEVFTADQIEQWDAISGEVAEIETQIQTEERLISFSVPEEKKETSFRPTVRFNKKKARARNGSTCLVVCWL